MAFLEAGRAAGGNSMILLTCLSHHTLVGPAPWRLRQMLPGSDCDVKPELSGSGGWPQAKSADRQNCLKMPWKMPVLPSFECGGADDQTGDQNCSQLMHLQPAKPQLWELWSSKMPPKGRRCCVGRQTPVLPIGSWRHPISPCQPGAAATGFAVHKDAARSTE